MPKVFPFFLLITCLIGCKYSSKEALLKGRIEKERYYYPISQEKYFNKQLSYATMRAMVDSMYANDQQKNFWSTYLYYTGRELVAYMKEQNVVALQYTDSAIAWIEQYQMQSSMPKDYGAMLLQKGRNYLALGDIPQAFEWHYKASEFIEKYQDACGRAGYIHSLAGVLYTQGSYALAMEKYKEELAAARQCPADAYYMHYGREQELLDNIGLCYIQLKQYDSAAVFFDEALKAIDKYKYLACDSIACLERYATNKGVVLGNYAKVFVAKNELGKAASAYEKAIELNTTLGYERLDAQLCMFQLSRVLMQEGKNDQAKKMLDKLRESLDTLPNVNALKGWNEMMSLYYAKTGNPQNELHYFKNFIALKDSIAQSMLALKQNNLLSQLEDKKKQVKLNSLEVQNKQKSNLLFWVLIGVLLLAITVGITYWFYHRTKKNNKLLVQLNTTIQEQNIRNEETLVQLKKINIEKDRILKVVAHDLRNPISGLSALLETLIDGDIEEERRTKMMEVAKNTSTLSMHLIDELLKNDHHERLVLTKSSFWVNELIIDSIELVMNKAEEKKQQIEFRGKEDFTIMADKEKIQRVLLNLLTNAIKFSYNNALIEVNSFLSFNNIVLVVKDHGIGIDNTLLNTIFETDNTKREKGTALEESFGFGLTICKEIIEAHGGSIWAESELKKGSSFYVALPLSKNI